MAYYGTYNCDICGRPSNDDPVGLAWAQCAEGLNLIKPRGYQQVLLHVCDSCTDAAGQKAFQKLTEVMQHRLTP